MTNCSNSSRKKKWNPHDQAQRKERQDLHTADVVLARVKLWVAYDSTASSFELCLKRTDYAKQNGNDAGLVDPFLFPNHPQAVSQTVKAALRAQWPSKRFPETRPKRAKRQGEKKTWYPFLRLRTEAEVDALLAEDESEDEMEDEDDEVKDGMPALEPLANVKYVFDNWEQVWSAQYQQHYYYNRYSFCLVSFLT